MKRKAPIAKRGKSEASKLKAKLDTVFSEYIRKRDSVNGIAKCVTCPKADSWKRMQCGHYIPRNHMATRFDEKNCHVQCVGCNMFKGGNYDEYALFLVSKYGDGILEELNRKKHSIMKWSTQDYQDAIEHYKQKIADLDGGNTK